MSVYHKVRQFTLGKNCRPLRFRFPNITNAFVRFGHFRCTDAVSDHVTDIAEHKGNQHDYKKRIGRVYSPIQTIPHAIGHIHIRNHLTTLSSFKKVSQSHSFFFLALLACKSSISFAFQAARTAGVRTACKSLFRSISLFSPKD